MSIPRMRRLRFLSMALGSLLRHWSLATESRIVELPFSTWYISPKPREMLIEPDRAIWSGVEHWSSALSQSQTVGVKNGLRRCRGSPLQTLQKMVNLKLGTLLKPYCYRNESLFHHLICRAAQKPALNSTTTRTTWHLLSMVVLRGYKGAALARKELGLWHTRIVLLQEADPDGPPAL